MDEIKKLHDLYIKDLHDLYSAEKQIIEALPKMIKKAKSERLRKALETHLDETKVHVKRLNEAFKEIDEKPAAEECKAMRGILTEAEDIMNESDQELFVLDAAMIAAAQKVEHYEISAYGTLINYANILGYEKSASILSESLKEEKNADELLSQIALEGINLKAEIGK
jgi:ferritin-like metal-binding protein YciE